MKIVIYRALVLILLLCYSSCTHGGEKVFKKSRLAMDTVVTLTVVSSAEQDAEAAINKAFAEIDRLSKLLDHFSKDSEVTLINRSAGLKPVSVSKETFEVIGKALYVSEKTFGAFDITVGPLMDLWDFREESLPDSAVLKEKLSLVGYRGIILNAAKRTVLLKRKGMAIDLGGIAKGYIADKVVEVLKSNGIKAGIAAMAGDIKAFGRRPDGKPWRIGIKNPRPAGKENGDDIIAAVDLTDTAISTAGDYERYFIKNNVRYHHILDPKTGYPANECRSVSIITADGVYTDGFDNGIFVLGPKRGREVLGKLGLDGIIVDSAGNITFTDAMKGKLELREK